jgi:tRNA G10  N-methylase Trm11
MNYLFFIGRTFELATAELHAVLSARYPEATIEKILPTVVEVSNISEEQAVKLQTILGGLIKIAKVEETLGEVDKDDLERSCAAILSRLATGKNKISFGVAEIGRDTLPAVDLREIKQILVESDISARFVEGTRDGLSASVLLHQDVEECVVVRAEGKIRVGYTIAVQNIDEWTVRDRQKPAADREHGMLPPKIARLLVNLALPAGGEGKRLLDPFCGTGTVVLEAMMVGAQGLGTDLRIEAIGQTQKNCEWFQQTFNPQATFHVALCDATHLTPELLEGKVDAIAAEGFLGPQTPRPGAMPNHMKGLQKLYRGAFKQWTKILNPGSKVTIALPRMNAGKTSYSLSSLVDSLGEYGYNISSGPFTYDRPDAIVGREIFVLEFKG